MLLETSYPVQLWQTDELTPLLTGLKLAPGSAEHAEFSADTSTSVTQDYCAIGLPIFQPSRPTDLEDVQCSYCQVTLTDRNEQIKHYKLDWHRVNIKRSLTGKTCITEQQFLDDISDSSSISGSEDEESDENTEDDDEIEKVMRRQPSIFFINCDGIIVSLHRCILFGKNQEICGEQDAVNRAMLATRKLNWTIIMLGGGHFAAAVFRGKDVLAHKTFHSYTVRCAQGGSQSSKDGKNASSHPKSAGAALRRYNEQSHLQHVQELMEAWKTYIDESDLVFIRAPGNNRKILFGGRNPLLSNSDNRLRTVPFPTRRATFSEVKRVHQILSQVKIYGSQENFFKMIEEVKLKTVEKKLIVAKKVSKKQQTSEYSTNKGMSEDNRTLDKELADNFGDLECSNSSFKGKGKVESEKNEAFSLEMKDTSDNKTNVVESSALSIIKNHLYTVCKTGDLATIKALFIFLGNQQLGINNGEGQEDNNEEQVPQKLLEALKSTNTQFSCSTLVFGNSGKTPLHIASENGQNEIVWHLLQNGCDPSNIEANGYSAYNVAKDKETRNVFRRFMAQFPDKYDYKKAGVSSPLTAEQEAAAAAKQSEKKKAQRKAKVERDKLKKQVIKEKKKEMEEKNKFLNLSDREKRAIAAEKRLTEQKSSSSDVALLRCFQCAADITNMVPFEYSSNKFCSTSCVREHRHK